LNFGRYALTCCGAAAVLAGCALPLSQPAPSGVSATSRMVPKARGQDLMYVATETGWIYLTTYPDGKEVGSIDFGPYFGDDGECADASGNVWIAGGYLAKFAHGGTRPIKQLDNGAGPFKGCSVDPTTGDLATVSRVAPKVIVWPERGNRPKVYGDPLATALDYCGYDDRGNLFIDGVEDDSFRLLELPKGGDRLQRLTLDKNVSSPGEIQWDGRYITIQEAAPPAYIYQVKLSGTTASVVHTIRFSNQKAAQQSWIAGRTALIPHSTANRFYGNAVGFFRYPAGGRAIETLTGRPYKYITAVTVSVAPQ
jgi:hypothetical protein